MKEIYNKYGYQYQYIFDDTIRIMDTPLVNCYLIKGSERSLLIDTGCARGYMKKLIDELSDNEYYVVNSHGHHDHISADFQFEKVYMNKDDFWLAERLFESEEGKKEFYDDLNARTKDKKDIFFDDTCKDQFDNARLTFELIEMNEDTLFDLGNKTIKPISVSGHTKGSMVFLDESNRVLYTGDAIIRHMSILHLGGTSLEEYRSSLVRLWDTYSEKFDYMTGTHGHVDHGFRPLEKEYILKMINCIDSIEESNCKEKFDPTGIGYEYYLDNKQHDDFDGVCIAFKKEDLKDRKQK